MSKKSPFNQQFCLITCLSILLFSSLSTLASVYVGSEQCSSCHQQQTDDWKISQHAEAMSHVSESTVLADFDNVTFEFSGKKNKFFRKGEEFWVNIEGKNNTFNDYQIKYTFAVYPLQQYMVEFSDGRVQLIPFAWDSRTEKEGGQRWFHLYPEFTDENEDFFWLNQGQNWNYMCADCHSTNLQKNYDKASNTYNTQWSEINVACEACHGPASEHMLWSKNKNIKMTHFGFDRDLGKAVTEWEYQPGKKSLQAKHINDTDSVRTCAQCHSRRTQLAEKPSHVKGDFLDRHLLSLITPSLYHKDGQIYDENYVYGSFLQSKMAKEGVVCTDCHNPHSAKIKMPEPALCLQCHIPTDYTVEKHSHHLKGLGIDQCSSCHMPEEKYMQIDLRKDHSWSIPRPDLSIATGVPNACTSCHKDKNNDWALDNVKLWFPDSVFIGQPHFATVFAKADQSASDNSKELSAIAQNPNISPIIRASALQRMQIMPTQDSLFAIQKSVMDDNAMLRLGSISATQSFPDDYKWKLLVPLLNDKVLAIRTEVAATLMYQWPNLSTHQKQQLQPALDDYKTTQEYLSDRGFGRANLGNLYSAMGDFTQAEREYLGAIEVEPIYPQSYINLSDLYRRQEKHQLSADILIKGTKLLNDNADLTFAAALAYIRLNDIDKAISMLNKATELQPKQAHYFYVLGMAYERKKVAKANAAYNQAYKLSKNPQHLYALCNSLVNEKSFQARQCLKELEKFMPQEAQNLLKNL